MTLFEELMDYIKKDVDYCIDFNKKNLYLIFPRINGKKYVKKLIVKNGKCNHNDIINCEDSDTIMKKLTYLWLVNFSSVPSQRSSKKKCWFKTKSIDEMSNEEMLYGSIRHYSQAELELYFFLHVIKGDLSWKEEWKNVYWKNPEHNGMVLMKSWF